MKESISKQMRSYFEHIDKKVKHAYDVTNKARKLGFDPEDKTNIPSAKNLAERVEGLVSAVAPQIIKTGIAKRLTELEKKYGALDWRVALKIAEEIALEKFCRFSSKLESIETGIRVGFAYLTLGTVSSPLEGFTGITIRKRHDGKEYFAINYSGPVRSAGGTAAAFSVILADHLRKKFSYETYDPTENEIQRMVTELYDYHERITNLQYLPSREEIAFLIKNLPVQIDGDPSENIEVSNYKDLARIKTNKIRSGPCLVIGESLAQKAPKLWSRLSGWLKEFSLEHWSFLKDFVLLQKEIKSKHLEKGQATQKISPVYTYISDLVAGRPVLSHPLTVGGLRLRYGRTRSSGYSSASIHPSLTHISNNYIATGTQLRLERPGKAASVTLCDSIAGPIVKLKDGSVLRLDSEQLAKKLVASIEEILFLGDLLVNYGDFYNRAHTLIPPGYCEEWWILELEKATVNLFGTLDSEKLSGFVDVPLGILNQLFKNPLSEKPTASIAIKLSEKLGLPFHPAYTYHWKNLPAEYFSALINSLDKINISKSEGIVKKIIIPLEPKTKRALELTGLPHVLVNNEYIIIEKDDAFAFAYSFNLLEKSPQEIKKIFQQNQEKNPLDFLNHISKIKIRDKSGIFIGARMGRPEKAKMRKMTGSPHVLFPVGEEGGKMRSFQSALEAGKVTADFPLYHCSKCGTTTIFPVCEKCSKKTKKMYYCKSCGLIPKPECSHGIASGFKKQEIDINYYFTAALKNLGVKTYPDMIKGVRGTSNKSHFPEHLIKGILRAKNEVYVNKDGTTRYDMTQLPITHFKPKEIGTPIEKLREQGYEKDIHSIQLENNDQILELKPLDVILPSCNQSIEESADTILFRVSKFIDDLLTNLYNAKPFYSLSSPQDLVGHLVLCLAPHTSAGTIGRIIGFSKTQGFYAHPMLHAATRRDCDGDEASVTLLMDALLNFSRQFLPNNRGATQDAPLVLTSHIVPSEVDDMVFDLDVVQRYPLEFYESCMEYKQPKEIDIETIGKRLNTEAQYENMGFTHFISNINIGVKCSAYKTLPSMEEKLKGQMDLAEKIRAVDATDVAKLVIEKHLLRDIKGNLRKFSQQQFRCVNCNEKFRRPPLMGRCTRCSGRIIFTISEGSIVKYLAPAISLAGKYNVPPYLKQTLDLTKMLIEEFFGKEKEKQEALAKWFG